MHQANSHINVPVVTLASIKNQSEQWVTFGRDVNHVYKRVIASKLLSYWQDYVCEYKMVLAEKHEQW